MHIVYIHQFFCTDQGAGGNRSFDVSKYLAQMGHQVTMICGVTDTSGLSMGPWHRPIRRMRMEGFDLLVCNVLYSQKQSSLMRMLSFLKFAFLASVAVLFMARRPDVVFATSLPLTVVVPGYLGSRLRRAPFFFEVRDICPEGDVICGYLRQGGLVERGLALLEWFAYVTAYRILLVSPGFQKRLIERGYPAGKMRTALLGADGEMFRDLRPDEQFRRQHGLEGKTLAVYTGAHGTANGLNYVLDAAALLKDRPDVAIALIGDGNEKARLKDRARQLGLTNVVFLDYVTKRILPGILAACDIGLMILRDVGERPVTPNKIFDYMFAGLPSIVNFRGPTVEMVKEDATGVFADPADPQQLADRITYWADHRQEMKEIGLKARDLAYRKYDRQSITRQLAAIFQEAQA